MQPQIHTEQNEENITPEIPFAQPQMPILAELLCSEESDHDLIESGAEGGGGGGDRSLEHCDETTVLSYFDSSILHHPDVMSRLKFLESQIGTPKNYFMGDGKPEILPYMRKVVASWMLEVCEEQRCDEAVFPLAIALLDQFLSTASIRKEQLQLVACVCLLLASKTRQCNHFSLDLLSWYTDNSVSPQSLRNCELSILSQLNWDVNVVTAVDFIDLLLVRTTCEPYKPNKYGHIIRRHAITFITLCATEPRFVGLKPSLVAASAIYTAVRGLRLDDTDLAACLSLVGGVPIEQLKSISSSIEQVISSEIKVMEQQGIDSPLNKERGIPGNSSCSFAASTASSSISEEVLV